jgi:hypothetical protein
MDSVEAQFRLTRRIPSPARMGRSTKVSDVILDFIDVRTPQAGERWKLIFCHAIGRSTIEWKRDITHNSNNKPLLKFHFFQRINHRFEYFWKKSLLNKVRLAQPSLQKRNFMHSCRLRYVSIMPHMLNESQKSVRADLVHNMLQALAKYAISKFHFLLISNELWPFIIMMFGWCGLSVAKI